MLFIADELAALFLNMGRLSRKDRIMNFGSKLGWRSPYTVERIGRPPLALPHLLVGIVADFQPDKLARSFGASRRPVCAILFFVACRARIPAAEQRRRGNRSAHLQSPFASYRPSFEENGVFASRKVRLSDEDGPWVKA